MESTCTEIFQELSVNVKPACTTMKMALLSPSPELSQAQTSQQIVNLMSQKDISGLASLPSPSPEPSGDGCTSHEASLFAGYDSSQPGNDTLSSTSGLCITRPFSIKGDNSLFDCSEFSSELNTESSMASCIAPFMSNADFIRALLTPVPDINEAGFVKNSTNLESDTNILCIKPNDLVATTSEEDEMTDDEEDSGEDSSSEDDTDSDDDTDVDDDDTEIEDDIMDIGSFFSISFDGTVSASSCSANSSKQVRFDMSLLIKELNPTRITGPPKQPGEESAHQAYRRALQEYREDLILLMEHDYAKRSAFNSYLHAAFPISREKPTSSQHLSPLKVCSVRKHSLDDEPINERGIKKNRAEIQPNIEPPTNGLSPVAETVNSDTTIFAQTHKFSTSNKNLIFAPDRATNDDSKEFLLAEQTALEEHPDFELLVKDNHFGRARRIARWSRHYPTSKASKPKEGTI